MKMTQKDFKYKKWLGWLDSGRSSKGKAVPKTRLKSTF